MLSACTSLGALPVVSAAVRGTARKRVLVAHPRVTATGGGNAVAAWTLEARRHLFTVEAFCAAMRAIVERFA